ncbi:Hint domain-containing protein [Cerasicoccus maritimus]|uniref:Hint domain-containing protein n=1 Tax=Cerasicoccus maritimus TaxID=490089 RepID=UPI0028527F43|nr:Hint domain-containing protein [Cerasicoccus maritimus]
MTRFLKRNTGCFVAGTLVWTTAGAVPIEDLALGDAVLTDAEAAQHEVINEQPDRSIEVKLSLAEADGDRFDMQSIVSGQWLEAMTGLAEADGWRYLEDFELTGQVVDL